MRNVEQLPERLLTKAEVAEHFRVTTRTIEVWMRNKRLCYLKIGRTVRFPLLTILKDLEESSRG